MSGSSTTNNFVCNRNRILKNLPLKKRCTYTIDPPFTNDENSSKTKQQSYSPEDSFSSTLAVPTPPSSPHSELVRQQYAHSLTNSTSILQQNSLHPLTNDGLPAQRYPTNYRVSNEQQATCGYSTTEESTIDEHFQKSLGNNYEQFTDRCLTPDDSSSNGSSLEQTAVNSIEEHFARSLAKFWSLNQNEVSSINRQITESIVDNHFAQALGSTTWEKLKDK